MIHAEKVKTGGMEIVNVDFIIDYTEPELIRSSVGEPAFHPAAGHPDGKAFFVMIAARGRLCPGAGVVFLNHRRAAKFTAPDDESLIEETTLFEIG